MRIQSSKVPNPNLTIFSTQAEVTYTTQNDIVYGITINPHQKTVKKKEKKGYLLLTCLNLGRSFTHYPMMSRTEM